MTNPHPVAPTEIDIRVSADLVVGRLRQGAHADAFRILEDARGNERPVVQEALDRYVVAGAAAEISQFGTTGDLATEHLAVVHRLQSATAAPRMPAYSRSAGEPNEFVSMTASQTYDVYASIADVRGDQTARDALRLNAHSVLLALRRENSTLASGDGAGRTGTGVYNDQIIVLIRGPEGERAVLVSDRANTEPTAQYSHHAGSDGRRPFSGPGGREEVRQFPPSPGYEAVTRPRKIEGIDANGDSMDDLGRIRQGTLEMVTAPHNNPRIAGTNVAFRPSPGQAVGDRASGRIERDTNADGYFTPADPNGIQDLNTSFKIHSGSRHNTDSAGCLTIHPADYHGFIQAASNNPEQNSWQLVLTSTEGGLFHNVEVGGDAPQPGAQPQAPAPVERPADYQGGVSEPSGPFEDPRLNRYYAAVLAGDSAMADRIALGFSFRAPELAVQSSDHDPARLAAPNEAHAASAQREAPGLQM
ncbi:hypothetical protein ACW5EG_01095 [Luteimonas sp. A611]